MKQISVMFKMYCAVTCPSLPELPNGEIDYSRSPITSQYFETTTDTFTCNSGFSLFGDNLATCLTSRALSEQTPTCKGNEI